MATALVNILSGGALAAIPKIIDSIKGKSPEDAAKLQQAAMDMQAMQQKYAADFALAQLQSDTQSMQMQADVNKVEAASSSWWVAGWRPYIGWCCGTGLLYQFLIGPLMTWACALAHRPVSAPQLDMGTLVTCLLGMLGIGGMRTYEKSKGVA